MSGVPLISLLIPLVEFLLRQRIGETVGDVIDCAFLTPMGQIGPELADFRINVEETILQHNKIVIFAAPRCNCVAATFVAATL